MFSPEDLQLIKGEPALRRRFFDMQISQTDPIYYDLLLKYNRVLQQRNKLLKDLREFGGKRDILFTWDKEFCSLAAKITKKRLLALEKMEKIASTIYSSLTSNKEEIKVAYELKGNSGNLIYPNSIEQCSEAFYLDLLQEREQVDILRGNTGIGPHRDDLQILLNGMFFDARRYDLAKVGRYKFNKKLMLRNRIAGFRLAEDVVDTVTGEILAEAGSNITKTIF